MNNAIDKHVGIPQGIVASAFAASAFFGYKSAQHHGKHGKIESALVLGTLGVGAATLFTIGYRGVCATYRYLTTPEVEVEVEVESKTDFFEPEIQFVELTQEQAVAIMGDETTLPDLED